MTDVLKLIGAGLLLVTALVFTREYERFLSGRLGLTRSFCRLLMHIRKKIDCFLSSSGELVSDFEDTALEDAGYLTLAREKGISCAYFERERELSLPENIKKKLSEFFRSFGSDYKESTVRLIDDVLSELERSSAEMAEENKRSVKLVRALAASAAIGAVILII